MEGSPIDVPAEERPISIILVEAFQALEETARRMPVWIISSKLNDDAVARVRAILGSSANITVVLRQEGELRQDLLARTLVNVYEHHGRQSGPPGCNAVVVFGASSDDVRANLIAELGIVTMKETEFGFVAELLEERQHRAG